MSEYVLGIDCGNTAVKAAIFDLKGQEIAVASARVDTLFPQAGYTESNLNVLWQSCSDVIRAALSKARLTGADIKAIGTSGHGNGLYLLDRSNEPLKAIKSLDSRAEKLANEIQDRNDYANLREVNHQGAWPSQTATLLKWLKIVEPETYAEGATVLFCKDYLNFKLSGELATDFGDVSASGLFDFQTHTVSEKLLQMFDISEVADKMPTIYSSEEIVGQVIESTAVLTGLSVGTPVIAGMFDVVSSAIGTGVFEHAQASMIAGTWSINQVVSNHLPTSELFMCCVFPGDRFLALENSATSASNLEWFVSEFFQTEKQVAQVLDKKVFEFCNDLVEQVELEENLPLFHPYLYGSKDNAHTGANFFGVSGWHNRAHLLYAVYEGIVFGHLEHVKKLARFDIGFDHVVLSGGGSRSKVWCQLFADVLNIEVYVTPCEEAGARGVAIAAATAVGLFSSLESAVSAMRGDYHCFHPNKDKHELLTLRQKKYQKISAFLNEW
ncbi:FGGY-family carbohydrate kinase [Reinekea sp.]|jgi:L-xylulokinase|uniref:FGGY-family carbohydrate kinase n=1 Tax=Reinekea sp. TaxID=1970455 RepID=UPI003988FCAE